MVNESRARALLDLFKGRRILVVGDCMLDHWLWGTVNRISPEAPVPVVEVERSTYTAGGAANVVHNLCKLGATAGIMGAVGADDAGRRLRDMLAEEGALIGGLIELTDRPTTTKMRIIAHNQQVVRADTECRVRVNGQTVQRLLDAVTHDLAHYDAILFSDYDKGILTPPLVEDLVDRARRDGRVVVAQPKPENVPMFNGVTVLAVNEREAHGASGIFCDTEHDTERAGREMMTRFDAGAVLITRGHRGMSLVMRDGESHHVAALARQVYDVSGAGDTVVSVLTLCLVAGATLFEATEIANVAAAIVVGKVGTATVGTAEIAAAFGTL